MIDWYLWALAAAAILVAAIAWSVPRAAGWVALMALSFCASSWWHDAQYPYPSAFGAFTDLVVIFALYAKAEMLYEMIVWLCFTFMIALDVLYLSLWINSHYTLAVWLEATNWAALLSIGAAGAAERAGSGGRTLNAVYRSAPSWPGAFAVRAMAAVAHLARD